MIFVGAVTAFAGGVGGLPEIETSDVENLARAISAGLPSSPLPPARYFVELNIAERRPDEILELDVVATSYDGSAPSRVLAEAKSGKWGYADIFKLCGWMRHLEIPRGAMFASKVPRRGGLEQLRERIARLDISVIKLTYGMT